MNRRGFLGGLLVAPAVIRTPGLLMPISRRFATWEGPWAPWGEMLTGPTLAEYAERILAPATEALTRQIQNDMLRGVSVWRVSWNHMPHFGAISPDEFFRSDD